MNEQIEQYLSGYPEEIAALFSLLRQLIYDCAAPEETLWARLPSYLAGEHFVRLIPFKDHINIEARAVLAHREELTGYKITPKGMLQLYVKQAVPSEVLRKIFTETLSTQKGA